MSLLLALNAPRILMAGYSQSEYSFHHSGFVELCPHRVTACGNWTSPVMVIAIDNLHCGVTNWPTIATTSSLESSLM
jgi:hypothetical protein